jgi:hypothetical protein
VKIRLPALLFAALLLTGCTPDPILPTPTTTASPVQAPTLALAPDLQAYLDEAIAIIEANSIYSASVNWESARQQAHAAASGAQTTADLYPVLRMLLDLTGDPHAYLMPPADMDAYFGTTEPEDLPRTPSVLLPEGIAVITIPEFMSGNPETVSRFAGQIQEAIRELDAARPCGWAVDLRNNLGGNGAAMLAGLGPLLGDTTLAYYNYPNGEQDVLRYQGGVVFYNDVPMNALPGPAYTLARPDPPIAVLTNELTNSAGELVAIAFRARPNTRSFGQRTNGLTTAPAGFVLPDGAALGVSTSYFADITGQTYPEGIIPDDVIPGVGDPLFRDPAVVPQEAIDWLLGQPACGGG